MGGTSGESNIANLWKDHFSAIANSVSSTDNRDQVMNALGTVPGHNDVINVHERRQIVRGQKNKKVKVKSSMARSLPVENLLPQNVGSILAVITEVAQSGAPSCSQPQPATDKASETVDPIDWSHPPPYTGQYPMSSTYCTLQCGLQITRLAALSQPRTCDFRMPDQCTAGTATQGIK